MTPERLAELILKWEGLSPDVSELIAEVERLQRELAAVREDGERLDWCIATNNLSLAHDKQENVWRIYGRPGWYRTYRDAIDAARKEEEPNAT